MPSDGNKSKDFSLESTDQININ